jgi:hypothetical protein
MAFLKRPVSLFPQLVEFVEKVVSGQRRQSRRSSELQLRVERDSRE